MLNIPVPYDRLSFFLKEIDIGDEELDALDSYCDIFVNKKHDFGEYIYDYFYRIPRTRIILDHDKPPRRLASTLASWFESLFKERLSASFLSFLWRSGLRHVDVNVDQRYVNLGYSAARQFCHGIIESGIALESRQKVTATVDKMLDICVLVATDAYVTATTRCDLEVIKGVAHQVRNPITVIGGNILRLQKKVEVSYKDSRMFESIIQETKRLERMVTDVGVYNEVFREDPRFTVNSIGDVTVRIAHEIKRERDAENVVISVKIDPENALVKGDARDLEIMFRYLLENSFEAVDPQRPYIGISATSDPNLRFVRVEIFNTGIPPNTEELESLYTPFYSSKPTGTGFGLPIARMVARKNLGSVMIEPVPDEGTRCVVILPKAEKV